MNLLAIDHNAVDEIGRSLYAAMSKQPDFKIRLLVPRHWHNGYETLHAREEVTSGQLSVIPTSVLLSSRTHRMLYPDLAREIRLFQPQILYMNAEPENFQTAQAARLLAHTPGTRLVFSTWRNLDYRSIGFPYHLAWLHAMAERRVLSRADHGIAFNTGAPPIFSELGFPALTIIAPEIDTSIFRRTRDTTFRERLGLGSFTIGFAGRLADQKGIPDLFHASALVAFDHQILIVGVGPMKDRLVALGKELKIGDRIVWMDPVRRCDMPLYLSAMDVLVLPSHTGKWWKEQFGRVLIEAMACEVPVIGSDSGEIPAVVEKEGLIFQEGNPVALASALTSLYENAELRATLAAKGLKKVKSRYSVDQVAPQYAALFRSLMG